jgi:Ca-activated chloride channel family protein
MALFAWLTLQIPAPPPATPTTSQGFAISREVDFVVLPVTVRNREGQFVSGLEASKFQVYENGRRQAIALFRSEDTPVTLGLVVDRSGSMAARSNDVVEGALAFVEASNPQDEEFVINFTERIKPGLPANIPFTSNANELRAALSTSSRGGKTALYDAVAIALQHIDLSQAGKKVLILISDGGDDASQHNFSQVLRMAQSANVVIYAIGLYDEHSSDQNPKVLRQFAKETGGLDYSPSSTEEVVRVCRQIAGDVRHQYTIGYSPADVGRNTYRKIRVEASSASHEKLSVRTRAGYFPAAGKQTESRVQPGANP